MLSIDNYRIYDSIVIWKIILLVIMVVFTTVGGLCFLCGHGSEGVYPQSIRKTVK